MRPTGHDWQLESPTRLQEVASLQETSSSNYSNTGGGLVSRYQYDLLSSSMSRPSSPAPWSPHEDGFEEGPLRWQRTVLTLHIKHMCLDFSRISLAGVF